MLVSILNTSYRKAIICKENLEGRTLEIIKRPDRIIDKMLKNLDLDKKFSQLPEVIAGKDLWQNDFHEFDVYGHTLDYINHLNNLTSDSDLIAAGYLHDIGKPVVAKPKIKNGKVQEKEPRKQYNEFDDHEQVGEEMVRKMSPKLFEEFGLNQERVARLVGAHYLPMLGIKSMRKAKNYTNFQEEYQKLGQTLDNTGLGRNDVLLMFLADKLAQGKFCTDKDELFAIRNSLLTNKPSSQELYSIQKEMYGGKE